METKFGMFFRLTLLSIFVSFIITLILLFEYTSEYHAQIIMNGNIIILLTYFIFLSLIPVNFFVFYNNEKIFKAVFQVTAIFIIALLTVGMFAKFKYSPQRIFLREFNLGGRTEKIIFKKVSCEIPNTPKKAFLIYKGNNLFYYETKNSVIGINKECLFDPMFR